MKALLNLVVLGTVITAARGRVTPGLCFELRLSTGGRYSNNLGHQLEGIGPLLAAGVRQQPAAIVATCVEINQCVGCSHFSATSDVAALVPSSGEEPTPHERAVNLISTQVATHAPPMSYFEGAFQAVFPGTALVKGAAPAGLCRTTKTFKGSGCLLYTSPSPRDS